MCQGPACAAGLWSPAMVCRTWTTFSSSTLHHHSLSRHTLLFLQVKQQALLLTEEANKIPSLPFVLFHIWCFFLPVIRINWPVTPGGRGSWILTGLRKSTRESWERQSKGLALHPASAVISSISSAEIGSTWMWKTAWWAEQSTPKFMHCSLSFPAPSRQMLLFAQGLVRNGSTVHFGWSLL